MKNTNSIYLLNMPKFWIWDTCRPFFRNKITKHVDGPSISYKDEHFAENYIKIGWKFKKVHCYYWTLKQCFLHLKLLMLPSFILLYFLTENKYFII
jgi:hypothetical protein